MNVTWTQLDDAIYALLALALLYLGWLAGYASRDWRDWLARRRAPQPEIGDDVVAEYGSAANADAELAALTDADALARDCPACTGLAGRPWCCCITHCGSQACRAGMVRHG